MDPKENERNIICFPSAGDVQSVLRTKGLLFQKTKLMIRTTPLPPPFSWLLYEVLATSHPDKVNPLQVFICVKDRELNTRIWGSFPSQSGDGVGLFLALLIITCLYFISL